MQTFILQVLARIREAQSALDAEASDGAETGWDRLQVLWLEHRAQVQEAPLELIVDHAARLLTRVEDTAAHPRRVLKRTRELMAIDRI